MLIIVYGDDSFRVQEKVRQLTDAFKKKFDPTGMNLASFGEKADVGEVMQAVRSMPFMGEKRMVVIRDLVSKSKKGDEDAWVGLKATPDSTIVVLWESDDAKALEKKALFKSLKDAAELHLYPFPVLEGPALTKWITERITSQGGKIAPAAATEIASRVSGDLWQADGEIRKLTAFASGREITADDVRELVRPSFEGEIFAFIDAVSQRNGKEAFRLLAQERSAGSEDHYLLAMLARQVRILLGVRAMMDEDVRVAKDAIATELALHPFVAQKAMAAARRFTLSELMAAHDALFEREVGVKSGMDPETAVDLMTVQMTG
ncbi:DNA polymerase III subunit delta [Patescibacteria group bacterium]|nr:MAG: DNA polymerase III subunit delta [Patescibacteria group bacterium]